MNPPHAHPVRSRDPVRLAIAGEEMTLAEFCVAVACGTAGVVFFWIVYVFVVGAWGP